MRIIGVFVVLFFAMIEDVESRRIRNIWVIMVFFLNFVLNLSETGPKAALMYPVRIVLWIFLFFLLYQAKWIGAGDAKLLAVIAAAVAGEAVAWFWTGCLLSAGVISLYHLACRSDGNQIPLALPIWFGYMTFMVNKGGIF